MNCIHRFSGVPASVELARDARAQGSVQQHPLSAYAAPRGACDTPHLFSQMEGEAGRLSGLPGPSEAQLALFSADPQSSELGPLNLIITQDEFAQSARFFENDSSCAPVAVAK
ncbi:unnamed protein product [Arctogadus glacialis]